VSNGEKVSVATMLTLIGLLAGLAVHSIHTAERIATLETVFKQCLSVTP
jgi:hypothetical protein